MITSSNLIAQIQTDLKQYNESGLLDELSLNLWIKNGLEKFGGNIMPIVSTVLKVKNGQVRLPHNFYSLISAVKFYEEYEQDEKEDTIEDFYRYKVRKEAQKEWDNQSNSYKDGEFTEITETTYFHDGRKNRKKPELLKISKGSVKIHTKNVNLNNTTNCQYEIKIEGDFIKTNFNTGNILIEFQGLPVDENDELIIPEVQGNYVFEYLENHLKRKIYQNLWSNGDDENVQAKVQFYLQLERDSFSNAMTSAKFEGMGGRWWKDMVKQNKKRTEIFGMFARGK